MRPRVSELTARVLVYTPRGTSAARICSSTVRVPSTLTRYAGDESGPPTWYQSATWNTPSAPSSIVRTAPGSVTSPGTSSTPSRANGTGEGVAHGGHSPNVRHQCHREVLVPDVQPVTVTVARRVVVGYEREFTDWAEQALAAASRRRGFLGGGVLRPPHAGADWHIVYRFASSDALATWESSDERAELLRQADELIEAQRVQRTTGLETWFEMPGRTAPAPPRWKMAAVTLLAIIPIALAVNVFLLPLISSWPVLARTLVFAGLLTGLMTWVVMPRMTRWFAGFLYPPPRSTSAPSLLGER